MVIKFKCLALTVLCSSVLLGIVYRVEGKPSPEPARSPTIVGASGQVQTDRRVPVGGTVGTSRRIVASRTDDGFWKASARLPTSSETGGNEHSRYKIRRDGSLSVVLQEPRSKSTILDNWPGQPSSLRPSSLHSPSSIIRSPKEAPTELRSFSVVLSDVDVVGRYGKKPQKTTHSSSHISNSPSPSNNEYQDSYSEAGVSSYHLHSNSIHRMNASWKLNPSNSSPTSEELLEFLSLFTDNNSNSGSGNNNYNNKEEEQSSHSTHQFDEDNDGGYKKFHHLKVTGEEDGSSSSVYEDDPRNPSSQSQIAGSKNSHLHLHRNSASHINVNKSSESSSEGGGGKEDKDMTTIKDVNDVNLMPFSTWSDSSRRLPGGLMDSSHSSSNSSSKTRRSRSNNNNNNNKEEEGREEMSKFNSRDVNISHGGGRGRGGGSDDNGIARVVLHDLISTLGKFNKENSENGTRGNYNRSSSGNSSTGTNEHGSRMKPTDPHQAASDLKKLMSLLMQAEGNSGNGGGDDESSGANIINIVIAPTFNSTKTNTNNHNHDNRVGGGSGGSGQGKVDNQKILFLKSPQVKQLLDTALSDIRVSSAAQKIAAALHAPSHSPLPPFPVVQSRNPSGFPSPPPHQNNYFPSPPHISHISSQNGVLRNETKIGEGSNPIPTTPDGFPLTASGFLNLHHPNLQFHQALHHLIANGSAPTTINATTRTNVINIFVLNFNGEHPIKTAIEIKHKEIMLQREREQQQQKQHHPSTMYKIPSSSSSSSPSPSSLKSPFANIKPILLEKVQQSPIIFFNKMGESSTSEDQQQQQQGVRIYNTSSSSWNKNKEYEPFPHFPPTMSMTMKRTTTMSSSPSSVFPSQPSSTMTTLNLNLPNESTVTGSGILTTEKINILDLLPGDFNAFTKIEFGSSDPQSSSSSLSPSISDGPIYDDKVVTINSSQQGHGNAHGNLDPPIPTQYHQGGYGSRDPEDLLSLISHLDVGKPSAMSMSPMSGQSGGEVHHVGISGLVLPNSGTTEVPPELAHLSWLFKNEPPPKPLIRGDPHKKDFSLPSYDDPDFPDEDLSMWFPTDKDPGGPPDWSDMYEDSLGTSSSLSMVNDYDEPMTMLMTTPTTENPVGTTTPTKKPGKRIPFYPLRNNQSVKDPYLEQMTASQNNGSDNGNSTFNNGDSAGGQQQTQSQPVASPVAAPAISINNAVAVSAIDFRARVKKLITALGYSALPTLAAGAAATWPYWVPLVATGKRKKRRKRDLFNRIFYPNNEKINIKKEEIDKYRNNPTTKISTDSQYESVTQDKRTKGFEQLQLKSSEEGVKGIFTMRKPKFMKTGTNSSSSSSLLSSEHLLLSSPSPSPSSSLKNDDARELKINSTKSDESLLPPSSSAAAVVDEQAKWIKVEVITESSPTSSLPFTQSNLTVNNNKSIIMDVGGDNNGTIRRTTTTTGTSTAAMKNDDSNVHKNDDHGTDEESTEESLLNKRRLVNGGQPHDVPLLKNFLKNVLTNEWNISSLTTTPSPPLKKPLRPVPLSTIGNHLVLTNLSQSSSPSFPLHSHKTIIPSSLLPYLDSRVPGEGGENINKNTGNFFNNNYPLHQSPTHGSSSSSSSLSSVQPPSSYMVMSPPSKFETFKPAGQSVSILIGQRRKKPSSSIPNSEEQAALLAAERRKKKLTSIVEAEQSYTSAALFPIWFPILFGNRKSHSHQQQGQGEELLPHQLLNDMNDGRRSVLTLE